MTRGRAEIHDRRRYLAQATTAASTFDCRVRRLAHRRVHHAAVGHRPDPHASPATWLNTAWTATTPNPVATPYWGSRVDGFDSPWGETVLRQSDPPCGTPTGNRLLCNRKWWPSPPARATSGRRWRPITRSVTWCPRPKLTTPRRLVRAAPRPCAVTAIRRSHVDRSGVIRRRYTATTKGYTPSVPLR